MNIHADKYRFIDSPITVVYNEPPMYEKKPDCPNAIEWDGEVFPIREMLNEWVDYTRRGRMARNMSDAHSKTAAGRGSWGVGRFFFRVRVESGRIFDIYYDRAPQGIDERKGHWILFREIISL